MERWNSLPPILRQIILGAVLFMAGAALSFGYSYRPLHGALVWKVDALETRLDQRNRENLKLKDQLARVSEDESTRVEPETLAQVEKELSKTKQALQKAERESKRIDKKRRDANATADRWRKRYESLRDQQAALPAAKGPVAAEGGRTGGAVARSNPAQLAPASTPDAATDSGGATMPTDETEPLRGDTLELP
jgi:hypothetical protein